MVGHLPNRAPIPYKYESTTNSLNNSSSADQIVRFIVKSTLSKLTTNVQYLNNN